MFSKQLTDIELAQLHGTCVTKKQRKTENKNQLVWWLETWLFSVDLTRKC